MSGDGREMMAVDACGAYFPEGNDMIECVGPCHCD